MIFKIVVLSFVTLTSLFALTAHDIAKKVDDRDDGDNITSKMKMILIDKNGKRRIRTLLSFTKYKGPDKLKLLFFLSPADVKNTAFLTYDYDDSSRDDDQWLYLPELKKVKRIASSDKSSSFMGSDFTYSDMTTRDVDDYKYKIMKEPIVNGHKCWQMLVIPKSKDIIDETGYVKSIIFVRQDNFVVVQALYYIKSGRKLKYMRVTGLKKIDNIWTITQMQAVTKKGRKILHKTILEFNDIKYNQNLKESFFSVRTLERGI